MAKTILANTLAYRLVLFRIADQKITSNMGIVKTDDICDCYAEKGVKYRRREPADLGRGTVSDSVVRLLMKRSTRQRGLRQEKKRLFSGVFFS